MSGRQARRSPPRSARDRGPPRRRRGGRRPPRPCRRRPPSGASTEDATATSPPTALLTLRIGVALTVIGFLLHAAADVLRGIAAGRVPWANMYEFAMTGTLLIVSVFLIVHHRRDLRFLGTFVTGLVLSCSASRRQLLRGVVPLPPALQSAWLVIHVFVASLGTAFFALGVRASGIQLLQHRRETSRLTRELRTEVPRHAARLRAAREPGLPRQHRGLHLLDLHAHRRRHLGRARVGPLLGLGHQRGVDLHHLGHLRRLHPRPGDARLARIALGVACHHRLRGGDVQLRHRERVLQGTARVLGL